MTSDAMEKTLRNLYYVFFIIYETKIELKLRALKTIWLLCDLLHLALVPRSALMHISKFGPSVQFGSSDIYRLISHGSKIDNEISLKAELFEKH